MKRRLKITRGGQVSVPSVVRKRWGTSTVELEDRDDHVILRPAPDDPVTAASGALAAEFGDVSLAELRRRARQDEDVAIGRRRIA